MQRLAIYDMDKTITVAATWTPFLIHAARRRAPWRLALLPVAGLATLGYAARLIDRARLKQVTQALMIGRAVRPGEVAGAINGFATDIVARGVHPAALAQIAADRAGGYRIVLATASFRFYAAAIADRLGFDAVIATDSVIADGRLRSRIHGENCYGAAKLRMIEAWLAEQGIDRDDATIRFYSDHVSDAPVLAWADEAIATNPHAPLRAMAAAKGWRVADWGV